MLFDLRSPARRRAIKIIYTGLALLMAVGLVGFGIGGATSGGLFDVSNGCSGSSTDNGFKKDVAKAQKRADAQPRNPGAWAGLIRAQYQLASTGVDQNTGQFSASGVKQLAALDRPWKQYLSLVKDNPSPRLASVMVQAYGSLGRFKDAERAQQIVTDAQPKDPKAFELLANFAYRAKDVRIGDLAAQRSIELTAKDLRPALQERLKEAKAAATQPAAGAGGAGGTTVTPGGAGGATPVSPTG